MSLLDRILHRRHATPSGHAVTISPSLPDQAGHHEESRPRKTTRLEAARHYLIDPVPTPRGLSEETEGYLGSADPMMGARLGAVIGSEIAAAADPVATIEPGGGSFGGGGTSADWSSSSSSYTSSDSGSSSSSYDSGSSSSSSDSGSSF